MKMDIKNNGNYTNYKTETQWKKMKMVPKNNAKGTKLWANRFCQASYLYYSKDEVQPMNEKELLQLKEENHIKYEQKKERRRQAEHQRRKEELDYRREYAEMCVSAEIFTRCKPLGSEIMRMASELPAIKCDNPSKIIVFDVETTGLDTENDEILQISIIDGDGNILVDEFVRPYWTTEWDEAYEIHGITSATVKDAPYPHELIPKVKGIFESAELLIAYNNSFDLGMLRKWGIEQTKNQKQFDVMLEFAPIYGEWNGYYEDYKWQKLTTCASYFGYEFKAHDSLEDVRATLHCYNAMRDL